MQWGQHKAGIKQTSILWTEEDRQVVQDSLEGVLQHIRLIELGSEFFAKEVEPTGLLPMEMMLAHYRNAAVQGSGRGSIGEITSPRMGVQQPFADSAILEGLGELRAQIVKW